MTGAGPGIAVDLPVSHNKDNPMTLAATFLEAELANGKTTAKILDELKAATGYACDHSTLYRWKNGERNPRPEVRRYMLKRALPHLLRQGLPTPDAGLREWDVVARRLV